MSTRLVCTTLLALVAFACAPEPNNSAPYSGGGGEYGGYGDTAAPLTPANDDCAGNIPTFTQVSAFAKCAHCHASTRVGAERNGAPASVNFDSAAAADASGDAAVNLVRAGAMPPPSSGLSLSQAEREQLYEWVMCRM
ncbi:MAG TPA: hypothetical protein VJV78_29955 [Polyangiales bacterium]|nr:hypothetical protein [Polyangiales bacterium]